MVGSISSAVAAALPSSARAATPAPARDATTAKAAAKPAPTAKMINAAALAQRQKIAEALYDRSMTLDEGVSAMKRQQSFAAYAKAADPASSAVWPPSQRSR